VWLSLVHWWSAKGSGTEFSEGVPGRRVSYGVTACSGSVLLDFLDPRLAKDFGRRLA